MAPRSAVSPLFPYTTLFRSIGIGSWRPGRGPPLSTSGPLQAAKGLLVARISQKAHSQVQDRKSTRLNSSHLVSSYAVSCLKNKNQVARSHDHQLDYV